MDVLIMQNFLRLIMMKIHHYNGTDEMVFFCCISECASLIYIFCRLPYVEQPRTITQVFLPPLHMNSRHCYYDCPTPLYNGSSHSNYVRSAAVIMSTTNTYTTRHRTLIQTCLIYLYMYLCHNSLYFISQHVSLPLSYNTEHHLIPTVTVQSVLSLIVLR